MNSGTGSSSPNDFQRAIEMLGQLTSQLQRSLDQTSNQEQSEFLLQIVCHQNIDCFSFQANVVSTLKVGFSCQEIHP